MKKLASIIFAFFYVLTTVGVAVNMHYCEGELESIGVVIDAESCCNAETTCGCCSYETFLIQNDVDEQIAQTLNIRIQCPELRLLPQNNTFEPTFLELGLWQGEVVDPPPPEGCPLYLSNCSLTYYA